MDSVCSRFARSYGAARRKFQLAADMAGREIKTYRHPMTTPDGEEMANDFERVDAFLEQISLVARSANQSNRDEPWLKEHVPALHMQMIDTAEIVSKRYGISRERQDAYLAKCHEVTEDMVAAWTIPHRLLNNAVAMMGPVL